MIAFKRILCPVDFSDTSVRALTYAAAFAKWYEGELTVLHVGEQSVEPGDAAFHDAAVARLDGVFRDIEATGVKATPVVWHGSASESIVNCAVDLKADLIVMGTHGHRGFHRLLLGSVTEKVIRTTRSPLLTVPPAAAAAKPGPILFKKILCPIDFSPSALRALAYALELGRQADGHLTVLHALEYIDPEVALDPSVFDPHRQEHLADARTRQRQIEQARQRLHAQVAGESQTWCEIEEAVACNRSYKEILQRATTSDIDLIVMGAQGSGGLELMLYGSNTHHVVRAAPCPVLTVRA